MAIPNLGSRLGKMLHEAIAERFKRPGGKTDEAPAETTPPAAEAPPVTEASAATEAPAPEAPAATATAPAPESATTETAAPATNATTATVDTTAPTPDTASASIPASEPVVDTPSAAAPAAAPPPADATPAPPAKSAEELEEERLWGEVDRAWAAEEFEKVTELLDRLRTLQPEDAAEIDQKIAAAQYNAGAHLEQTGELSRALYLYQEARRRDPNLGEAGFAIERVRNAIDAAARPAAAPAPVDTPVAPATRTYTVESGDSLWAIAERFYGNGAEWTKIHEANREQVPNPEVIQPGQVLTIP